MLPCINAPLEDSLVSVVDAKGSAHKQVLRQWRSLYGRALGIASFDTMGLLIKSLGAEEIQQLGWTKVAFEAINLQRLLLTSLKLQSSRSIRVFYQDRYEILIAYKGDRYIAAIFPCVN